MKENKLLTNYDIMAITGIKSRQGISDIVNGKSVIYTNEIEQLENLANGYGNQKLYMIDTTGLRLAIHPKQKKVLT